MAASGLRPAVAAAQVREGVVVEGSGALKLNVYCGT
jgi:hypothetical protein